MSIEALNKCALCTQYISATKDGRASHMRQVHGVRVRQAGPYTPEEKAEIVTRLETRLGLEHFITPAPRPRPAHHKYRCNKCGPTNNEGYWLNDGTGICEPCVKQSMNEMESTITEMQASITTVDEEIQYHD